jgi:hypothetical protein
MGSDVSSQRPASDQICPSCTRVGANTTSLWLPRRRPCASVPRPSAPPIWAMPIVTLGRLDEAKATALQAQSRRLDAPYPTRYLCHRVLAARRCWNGAVRRSFWIRRRLPGYPGANARLARSILESSRIHAACSGRCIESRCQGSCLGPSSRLCAVGRLYRKLASARFALPLAVS